VSAKIKELRVRNFAELHDVLGRHRRDAGWVYRGHPDPDYDLVPRAGRPPFSDGHDEIFFRRWQAEAPQFLDETPADDWGWLALAQHHGLATRLLDWTFKPLAAAFFAVFEPGIGESVIYCFKTANVANQEIRDRQSPFERQGITLYTPSRVSHRVSRQIGMFTLHGPPTLSLQQGMTPLDRIERIVIDAAYRSELLFELNQYGINNQTLFPNLVGLSRHFNWITACFGYWAEGLTRMEDDDDDA